MIIAMLVTTVGIALAERVPDLLLDLVERSHDIVQSPAATLLWQPEGMPRLPRHLGSQMPLARMGRHEIGPHKRSHIARGAVEVWYENGCMRCVYFA